MVESGYIKKFTISSTVKGLRECLEIACTIQKQFNFDSGEEFAFQTVLAESVTNAITHGNKLNENLLTTVTIAVNEVSINIEVEDQGDGFDLDRIASPIDQDHLNLENGRGIFFIRKLSNSFVTKGKGNIVNIIINR